MFLLTVEASGRNDPLGPLLALSEHYDRADGCPLSGVWRENDRHVGRATLASRIMARTGEIHRLQACQWRRRCVYFQRNLGHRNINHSTRYVALAPRASKIRWQNFTW